MRTLERERKELSPPIKSLKDKKEYKVLKLCNGLKVLLISDVQNKSTDNVKESCNNIPEEKGNQVNDDFRKRFQRTISIDKSATEKSNSDIENKRNSFQRLDSIQDLETTNKTPRKFSNEEKPGGYKPKLQRTTSFDECCKTEKHERKSFNQNPDKFVLKEELETNDDNEEEVTEIKQSAAALCINVGSYYDPVDVPGLAHFLEHMVFMGSEKYPDENDFSEFIQKHGGYNNAWTAGDKTTFYFNIQRQHFHSGFDRFIQFFVSPLLKKDAMQREREAVDSEFEMGKNDDFRRSHRLFCLLSEPNHPIQNFGCGNLQTLKPKEDVDDEMVHQKLKTFFDRYYIASAMTLVVQSQHSIEDLEKLVVKSCLDINNHKSDENESLLHLTDPFKDHSRFSRILKVVPIEDNHSVSLNWSLIPLKGEYRTKPLQYICHLINHKGKGSLYSYLSKKSWTLGLSASSLVSETHSLISISILLTEKGHNEVQKVFDAVFSYLKMLREQGPNCKIYEELKKIMELEFEFEEEEEAINAVENLSTIMQDYPSEQYLSWWLYKEFDFELIQKMLNSLTPDNVNIFLSSKKYIDIATEIEPIYQTKYANEDIPVEWRQSWSNAVVLPEFELPKENIFIAQNLQLLPEISNQEEHSRYPVKKRNNPAGELYYLQDNVFKKPRAITAFKLCSGVSIKNAKDRIHRCILEDMINLLILEDKYPAIQALLGSSINLCSDGSMTIGVNGLNEKLFLLMKLIVSFLSPKRNWKEVLDETLFQSLLDQLRKDFFNGIIDPSFLASDLQQVILQKAYPTNFELLEATKTVDFESFCNFSLDFLGSFVYVKGLVQGNMSMDEACAMFDHVKDNMITKDKAGSYNDTDMEKDYNKLLIGEKYLRVNGINPNDSNTEVKVYYQSNAEYTLTDLVPLQVGLEFMVEPVFNVLRTKEQLGYVVYSALINNGGILGICITVKSPANKFTPDHIHNRIEAFVEWFIDDKMSNLSDDEFKEMISTMIKKVKTKDTNLGEEFGRNWDRIVNKDYMFDVMKQDAELLKSCSKSEVFKSISSTLKSGPNRKKLSVQVVGHNNEGTNDEKEVNGETKKDVNLEANETFNLEYQTSTDSINSENFIQDIYEFRNNLESIPTSLLRK